MRSSKRSKGSKSEEISTSSNQSKSTRKKSNKKKKGNKFLRGLKMTFLILLILCMIAGVALAGMGLAMIKTAPPLDIDRILSLDEPARFYDDQGNFMDEYISEVRRENVSINEVPLYIQNAFISIEDERFREHTGVDWYRLGGAIKTDIEIVMKKVLGKPHGSFQGASTITQQLVKQRLFYINSIEDRFNVERKVQEMYLAWQLDKKLSKDKILEGYLNTIFLGNHAYGVKAAANIYFSKDLNELTLVECAFLASAAQNPSKSSYLAGKAEETNNGVFYSQRTYAILKKMLELGHITQAEFDDASRDNVKDDTIAVNIKSPEVGKNKMHYESFSRVVIEAVVKDFKKQGKSTEEINNLLATGGLKIYTTMSTQWQTSTQEILDDKIVEGKTDAKDYLFPRDADLNPIQEQLQASAVVMDYHTGEVKVIIGGRGEQEALGFNRAASDDFLRAPGSCIKPLTVYGPAIDTKILTAGSVIEDSPLNEEQRKKYNVQDEVKNGKIQQYPRNAPREYAGYLTLREGLKNSKNTVAMKVVDSIGLSTAAEYGRKFGIPINDMDAVSLASMSLGQLSAQTNSGANPLKLATAYGSFGNKGIMVSPVFYSKVVSSTGEILLKPDRKSARVMSEEASYIMYDLLKEPVSYRTFGRYNGTGTSAKLDNMDTRGKTGTSGDKKDYWFTGFTPYYSCSIWVGTDRYEKIENGVNSMGSYYVGRIWNKVMTPIHENLENREAVEMPSTISKVEISMDSGTLPSSITNLDPRGKRTYEEIFINGTAPTTRDDVHVKLNVVVKDDKLYLPTEYSILGKRLNKVFIKREKKPFWGPDREFYSLVDEKYLPPTEEDPVPEYIKDLIDFWGPVRAIDFIENNENKDDQPNEGDDEGEDSTNDNNNDNNNDSNTDNDKNEE